jgi:hypothetical protein
MGLLPMLGTIWKAVGDATSSVIQAKTEGLRLQTDLYERSLCDAIVTMVQATDLWKSNNLADGLYGA